jgi:anti-anti-sigma regulatory factor
VITGMHLTPIGDGTILLEPGEALDPSTPDLYLVPLADYLQRQQARRLIYDLGALPVIDGTYYQWLVTLNGLCQIGKVEMLAVNMQPTAAFSLSRVIDRPPPFTCARDVDQAR